MSEVRVHVRLGTLRLDYHGEQAFYEAHVEALVAAAATRGVRTGGAAPRPFRRSPRDGGDPSSGGDAVAPSDMPSGSSSRDRAAPSSDAQVPPEAPARTEAYAPASPEFGRYLRRLGAEADAPDRHVLAFAFYLWNYERLETFGLAEIAGCLKAIGRGLPEDAEALMEDLTEKRRLLESVSAGRWRLAKKGENYVKTRLLTV